MISKTSKSVIYCLKPNKHDICPKKITQPQYLDMKFYTKKAPIVIEQKGPACTQITVKKKV